MSKQAIIVKLTAAPGKRDELVAALAPMLDQVENEPGTELYLLHTDAVDADTIWFYERYTDQAGFEAHSSSEAMKSFGAALGTLLGGKPEFHFVTPQGGKG